MIRSEKMRGRTQSKPFSHYRSLMNATSKPVGKPIGSTAPMNPALDGIKHTSMGQRSVFDSPEEATRAGGVRGAGEKGMYRGGHSVQTQVAPRFRPGGQPTDLGRATNYVGGSVAQPQPEFGGETFMGGAPEPGTPEYQQAMYNLAREQIQGQTGIQSEQMRETMGGQGFRAGESGIANRAIQNIQRRGSETLSGMSRGMGLAGMQQKYGQEQDAMNLMMRLYGQQQGAQGDQWNQYRQAVAGSYNR